MIGSAPEYRPLTPHEVLDDELEYALARTADRSTCSEVNLTLDVLMGVDDLDGFDRMLQVTCRVQP